MLELILSFFVGAVAGLLFVAWRQRVPGEPLAMTLARPLSGGGTGPRR